MVPLTLAVATDALLKNEFDAIRLTGDCPSSCNWNTQRPNLREDLAHLVDNIKRRVCGIASAGSPWFSV